jgi:hypothetical protein
VLVAPPVAGRKRVVRVLVGFKPEAWEAAFP